VNYREHHKDASEVLVDGQSPFSISVKTFSFYFSFTGPSPVIRARLSKNGVETHTRRRACLSEYEEEF
jgi:hypothetical protein